MSVRSLSGCALFAALTLSCHSAGATPLAPPPPPLPVGAAASPTSPPQATVAAVEDLQSAFKDAIAHAGPAVVSVYSTKTVTQPIPRAFGDPRLDFFFRRPQAQPHQFKRQGLGSGFVIDADGYILTNNHVIEGADEIKVKLSDDRELDAKLVGADPPTDLALLQVDPEGLTAVELGDSDALEVGDWVLAIGNPFGLPQTVSTGIVSAKGRANVGLTDYEDFIQTDAAVNPGNSGGPLVDLRGRVVGINTAIASRSGGNNGIAFAIPMNMAKQIVDQLRNDGKVVRGYLGVLISDLSPEMAETFDFSGEGILIQDVPEDTAAAKAGVRSGDIIVALDGRPVDAVGAFRSAIASHRPGSTVSLQLWRDGTRVDVDVTLTDAKGATSSSPDAAASTGTGMTLQDVTPQLQRQLSLREPDGVVITKVEPGSVADHEGIRPGDVLEAIGAIRVSSAAQASKLLRAADLARGVRLRLRRDGQGRFVVLKTH